MHHDYYEVPRESQYENFPPPPPQADYENLMDVRDSIEIIRESQANWPPMNEPQHESVKEFAATKNPYVFSTEDFTIEPERESHTHHKAEVHHDHTVSFDNHEEVIPPVEEVNRHSYQHREVVEDASERNSGASSEKSDGKKRNFLKQSYSFSFRFQLFLM